MLASVAYLRDQIQRKPRILQLGMEVAKYFYPFNAWKMSLIFVFMKSSKQTASVHSLSAQTHYALKQVSELQQQLKYLKKYLDKVKSTCQLKNWSEISVRKSIYLTNES